MDPMFVRITFCELMPDGSEIESGSIIMKHESFSSLVRGYTQLVTKMMEENNIAQIKGSA